MERRYGNKIKKIVLTGAESTGKSTLAVQLAGYYNTEYINEYAREYVENLNRKYEYKDVEYIAKKQVENIDETGRNVNNYLFIDTYLIIIKIWFLELYKKYPKWIDKEIMTKKIDLYLVCDVDLPWIEDRVRENDGKKRIYLHNCYLNELERMKLPYKIVNGCGEERLKKATNIINSCF